MQVIAHRGLWKDPREKNAKESFIRAFDAGLGTETDLRDICGKIVISHDMPRGNEISFEEVLQLLDGRNLPLALNIKADGQAEEIKSLLAKYRHTNYFCFDMSIPDMVVQIEHGLKVYSGMSDLLPEPVMLQYADGVWLDCFESDWYGSEVIDRLLEQRKKVCIVSADLHKRETEKQWETVSKIKNFASEDLMLCTDKPLEARKYWGI